jgi:hypothetical protein
MRHRRNRRSKSKSGRAISRHRPSRTRSRRIKSEPNLEEALRSLRAGKSQKRAAQVAGVPVRRFRAFLRNNKLANYKKGHWHFTDRRQRTVVAITRRGEKEIKVAGFNKASLVMQHRAAVRAFLNFPDNAHLELVKSFKDRSVTDTSGGAHLLETRPNVLFRYAASGPESYQVYKLPS